MPISEAWEIVTETEAEWTDDQRALMAGLAEYESELCECGWHRSLTGDKSNHFAIEEETCPVCAGAERWGRIQEARDERELKSMGDKPPPGRQRRSDGRRNFVRLKHPEEAGAADDTDEERGR